MGMKRTTKENSLIQAGREKKLFVVMDFDRTVTKCFKDDGTRAASCHGVLERCDRFSSQYHDKTKQLFDKYYPMEIDPKMAIDEKIPKMVKWYEQTHHCLIEERVTWDCIEEVVSDCKDIEFRMGLGDFFQLCEKKDVPVIIMSAGIEHIISLLLRKQFPDAKYKVISNSLLFDERNVVSGVREPILHMFNKTLRNAPPDALKMIEGKTHALLVGDSEGDLTMADGFPCKPYKIGFLNDNVEERREVYEKSFDQVVYDDGSFSPANELLEAI